MMHMSFWFGYENIQMIFQPWLIDDIPNLIGSCRKSAFKVSFLWSYFWISL